MSTRHTRLVARHAAERCVRTVGVKPLRAVCTMQFDPNQVVGHESERK
jgi:hypothetical protein